MFQANKYKHVNYLWDDAKAAKMDLVERLVYRSNILGADQRITNTGGGNTSTKITMPDPLTGEAVEVMWVKGSGGAAKYLWGGTSQRRENPDGRPDGGHVFAHRLQFESACHFN